MSLGIVDKPWLSPEEAAEYLSLPTVNALRSRMNRGSVPDWCYTKFGGSLRFNRAALDEHLEARIKSLKQRRAS